MRAAMVAIAIALFVTACASTPAPSRRGGIGKPPPEQAPVSLERTYTGPLITPDTDPFAIH